MHTTSKFAGIVLTLTALTASAMTVGAGTAAATEVVPVPPAKVLFIGDSITARYNNVTGSGNRGWWSYLAADMKMTPVTSAQGRSGTLRRGGLNCVGTTFGDRLPDIAKTAPGVIVLAGGRNDAYYCLKGKTLRASRERTRVAVRDYFKKFAATVKAAKIPAKNVYVLTPWGSAAQADRTYIWTTYRTYARQYGFQWVPVSYLTDTYTVDATHPNTPGNKKLYRMVRDASNLTKRFGA